MKQNHHIQKLCLLFTFHTGFLIIELILLQKDLSFVLVSHIDEVLQAAFPGGFTTAASPQDIGSVVSKL
jgi:hypothetical protein